LAGTKIVLPLGLSWCENAIENHHERLDGRGYPYGPSNKEEINHFSRIIAIADVFDAITSRRSYRPARTPDIALKIIKEESGRQFAPVCVDAFLKAYPEIIEIYKRENAVEGSADNNL